MAELPAGKSKQKASTAREGDTESGRRGKTGGKFEVEKFQRVGEEKAKSPPAHGQPGTKGPTDQNTFFSKGEILSTDSLYQRKRVASKRYINRRQVPLQRKLDTTFATVNQQNLMI